MIKAFHPVVIVIKDHSKARHAWQGIAVMQAKEISIYMRCVETVVNVHNKNYLLEIRSRSLSSVW